MQRRTSYPVRRHASTPLGGLRCADRFASCLCADHELVRNRGDTASSPDARGPNMSCKTVQTRLAGYLDDAVENAPGLEERRDSRSPFGSLRKLPRRVAALSQTFFASVPHAARRSACRPGSAHQGSRCPGPGNTRDGPAAGSVSRTAPKSCWTTCFVHSPSPPLAVCSPPSSYLSLFCT